MREVERNHRQTLGVLGERLACEHLRTEGYTILERNFRTRHGELDVVATADRALVFCEVKTRVIRGEPGPFGPLAAVGPAKQRRLRAMARQWLAARAGDGRLRTPELRFDAIGVTLGAGGELRRLEHLRDAF